MDGVDGDEAVRGLLPDRRDGLAEGDDGARPVGGRGHREQPRPGVDERDEMSDVELPLRGDAGPPDLEAVPFAPYGLPGRDVGHVVEVGDDEVGRRAEDAPQAEGEIEQGGRGRLMEADLAAVPGVEEVGGEVPDPGVEGGRLGFAGDDDAGHGVEPALGVAGRLGGGIDGQAARPGVEIEPGTAAGIPVDHREAPADLGIQSFPRDGLCHSRSWVPPSRKTPLYWKTSLKATGVRPG